MNFQTMCKLALAAAVAGGLFSAEDSFTNGDPYSGITYERPGLPSTPGGYRSSTFTPGAELTGAASDFAGTQFGVGALKYRYGDATDSTINLTPAGYTARSLSLVPQVVTGTALGLVSRDGRFEMGSFWNFTVPKAGESILLGIAGTGGPDFVDRLQLRFGNNVVTGQLGFRSSRSRAAAAPTPVRCWVAWPCRTSTPSGRRRTIWA